MYLLLVTLLLVLSASLVECLRYTPEYAQWNLNTNQKAENPLDYSGSWENHKFHASPANWRFPFYTLFLDRFVNGDPLNDNANETLFEQDITSTQFRHGGDVQGLIDSLDYIQGFGIKGIYIAGSPFINMPWQSDMYSPLDLTLLDQHFGDIAEWRRGIDEIHKRGMYVLLDNTVATMGDLIGFEGYLNESTPYEPAEHKILWKGSRRYLDFTPSNEYNETCQFPKFWNETGYPVDDFVDDEFKGCFNGDFDQFGDTEAFGVYPDYRRQLTKFASVQDRLREWVPSVRERLEHFSCIAIKMLDIDGFRFDKAIQVTVDASGQFSAALRKCARDVGKDNFFLPGEITGGNNMGSVYLGRGRQPNQWLDNITEAVRLTNKSDDKYFLRGEDQGALDAGAFHYSIYRFLTRFLGMDGNLEAGYDLPPDWVDAWNQMLLSNDFVNPNTGVFDPRHMFGSTNQDVFRWPAISQGVERFLLGQFITGLLLPGIPLLLWGEEVGFNVLDNTADNYIFGRQAMSPSPAWYMHGCYTGSSTQYFQMPLESARHGCKDITNSYDHRDPSHPIRGIIRQLYHLRAQFPTLNDGLLLDKLSKQTEMIKLPGSSGVETETGLWSVRRAPMDGIQDFGGPSDIWLVYHNRNETTKYKFDCSTNDSAIIAPFDSGVTVKNLLFPHDEQKLINSPKKLQLNGSKEFNGCVQELEFAPFEFRLYVPNGRFIPPPPMVTKFLPGHDHPILRNENSNTVNVSLHFNAAMDCDKITKSMTLNSSTFGNMKARINEQSVTCGNVTENEQAPYVGAIASAWSWSAQLVDVADGVHQISIKDAVTADGGSSTGSTDKFLIRIGKAENPIVHLAANYSQSLLSRSSSGKYALSHKAAGADMWRYSLNWGSLWSNWTNMEGANAMIEDQPWSGTKAQEWEGSHVMVQYWSRLLGSSSFVQHGDLDFEEERRFPHMFANGPFNQFGFDAGLRNRFNFNKNGTWNWHFMNEWPATLQLNVWGINPDNEPDVSFVYGDIDGDGVLDRLNPSSLLVNALNITARPPSPHLGYRIELNDGNLRYELVPVGNKWLQLALFVLLWISPIITGLVAVAFYQGSFYQVKYVARGVGNTGFGTFLVAFKKKVFRKKPVDTIAPTEGGELVARAIGDGSSAASRRKVLIATIEYNIDDWNIKVKIGGLGVMAQLMGKALSHIDLVWVVPCTEGIDYPDNEEERAEPMKVKILDNSYTVTVHYHVIDNITFVVLDAPIFRTTNKANPYPPRMDDIDSAVYYSTWNQCIAQAMERFEVDLYHINDYHGAAAPLYLLPKTIPCCLSLHNAEFQGLWPMRTADERDEVARVFNLPQKVVKQYIQYGSVFNLLHAGASYLRIHQAGFGAVGVSKKYGDRSYARYPIFWGLSSIGQLPNPDPSDISQWDKHAVIKKSEVKVDKAYEAGRGAFRMQAQEWAGLEVDPEAQLFVFVGRWSEQKGVDLIADIFPSILEDYPRSQLICVGPVIDLYGKFAALKLSRLMELYPKRVFSRPEFTMLPPYIHTGAEFALIPSRDEPFGLVAVEFGRKGALGVGARVGGLGQMPGWWYTIESMSSTHLLKQFKLAIVSALESKDSERALMRAWSAKQRFPVAQWLEGLTKLQDTAVQMHDKHHKTVASTTNTPRQSMFFGSHTPVAPTTPPIGPNGGHSRETSGPVSINFPESSRASSIHDGENDNSTRNSYLSPPVRPSPLSSSRSSVVNLGEIVGQRKDFALQQVDPFFTDADEEFYNNFKRKLDDLNANNSTAALCTEEYIVESTRVWFSRRHDAKVGVHSLFSSANSSAVLLPKKSSAHIREIEPVDRSDDERSQQATPSEDEKMITGFDFGENYVPPTGFRKYCQVKFGTWPAYSFGLALGQIIASNSYQITLLTGEIGQSAEKLYAIAGIYLGASLFWLLLTRYVKLLYLLTVPFFFYGLAFLLVGTSPFVTDGHNRFWMQNVATGFYAFASASGSLFFAFNFGDEGGAPITIWIWRACWIQALQHAYTLALWFWGSFISSYSAAGKTSFRLSALPVLFPVTLVVALLLWTVGLVLFLGLPSYYRQMPDQVPSLLRSIVKRKITLWFFVAVLLQNYFLSAPYGRNWFFLFSSQHVSTGAVLGLAFGFLIGGWGLFLGWFAFISKRHPWWLPVFAIGLGAPRWAQMLWGTSSFGLFLPWAGSDVTSALVSRCLWLWLGLLDAIQNTGVGLILLLTLTRIHVSVTLMIAQVLGSVATMVARATAPNKLGPGDVFPDFSMGLGAGLGKAWFWVALLAQLMICVGYLKFFRKEQISKP